MELRTFPAAVILKNGFNKFITTQEPNAHLANLSPTNENFAQYKSRFSEYPSAMQSP